jgi:hypothetical protein
MFEIGWCGFFEGVRKAVFDRVRTQTRWGCSWCVWLLNSIEVVFLVGSTLQEEKKGSGTERRGVEGGMFRIRTEARARS